MYLFWQKITQSDCVFQVMLGQQENSPSPLGDFNRLFEGLIGELFKTRLWNIAHCLEWYQSGPKKKFYQCSAGKSNPDGLPASNAGSKRSWFPWCLIPIVPKSPIKNIPSLVQIMTWRRPGDKPLSEPTAVSLLTHICITHPQWVKQFEEPVL